jgi:hypothetical protein
MEECQRRIFNMVQEAKKQADLPSETTLAALVSAKFNPELINHLSIFPFSILKTIKFISQQLCLL